MISSETAEKEEGHEANEDEQVAPGRDDGLAPRRDRTLRLPANCVAPLDHMAVAVHADNPSEQPEDSGTAETCKVENAILVQIPPEAVLNVYWLAVGLFQGLIQYSNGEVNIPRELKSVVDGQKQLWFVLDKANNNRAVAAGITSLQAADNGTKSAILEYFSGDKIKLWFGLRSEFEDWARREGCADVRVWARKGWLKMLPDYRISQYVIRKDLLKEPEAAAA